MNRRDIIIVAVIINAGLLVTLFVSSLKKEQPANLVIQKTQSQQGEIVKNIPPPAAGKDQIDQVISQYTVVAKAEEKETEKTPFPVLAPPPAITKTLAPIAPPSAPIRVVTVERGDALEKIARSHGVSVDEIMKLNKLSNSRLQIGQQLQLPEKKAPKKELKDEGNYYIVQERDNPWTIAQKNGMQVEELLRLNNMDKEKAKRLRPGDRLKIK